MLGKLFDELKRRNVFRVAIAYIVSAWLILQVADVVLNNLVAPDWVFPVFMLALALGFVPVLIFSWAYELTPEGLKRENEVQRDRSITRRTGRKLDMITIVLLVLVVAFVLIERNMFPAPDRAATTAESHSSVPGSGVDDKSIAVLAFDDLSQEGDQEFFADGLSEELLNVLSQIPGLKVAGRTSSFAFKGKDTDLREIGEILNVANILEGSVRKAGNRIRVTAQLIKASDGFHLFSKTYDRNLDDIFAVQDEIAEQIAKALQTELSDADAIPSATPTPIEAYDLYLLARDHIRSRNPDLMKKALDLLDQALAIDGDYAPALAERALAIHLLSDSEGAYGDIPAAFAMRESRTLIDKALALDPQLAEAYAVQGLLLSNQTGGDNRASIDSLRRALAINPNLESAKLWLANDLDNFNDSVKLYEDIILRDPLYSPAFNNLIQAYLYFGDLDKAAALIDRVDRITGPTADVRQARGTVELISGELAAANRDFAFAYDANPNASIVRFFYGYAALFIGDTQRAAEIALDEVRLIALRELGDDETADRIIDRMDFREQREIRHGSDYLAARGRSAQMVDIIDKTYGGAAGVLQELPLTGAQFGTEYLGSLAYVYLRENRDEDLQLVVGRMKTLLDHERSTGADNWYYWYCQAQYAALTGDADAAVGYLQRALDEGYVSVFFVEPLFDLLSGDARFRSIKAAALARANKERAELGMQPYQPILSSKSKGT